MKQYANRPFSLLSASGQIVLGIGIRKDSLSSPILRNGNSHPLRSKGHMAVRMAILSRIETAMNTDPRK